MKLKNGMELRIEKATKEDASTIIEYLNVVGGESDNLLFGRNEFYMSVAQEEEFIETVNTSPSSALLVGRIHNVIVCVGSIQASSRQRIAHQGKLALSVKKEYWNIGVAAALMQALIAFAKQTVIIEIIHLGVNANNANAIKLYEKMGFEVIGTYKKFFKINGEYSDEILMNLYL